jgi:hypothetical protein
MMRCKLVGVAAALLLVVLSAGAAAKKKYTIKVVADAAAPKELAEPIRKLLDKRCVQLLDTRGKLAAEVWFRKEVPVKATEAQIKNGLTYEEVPTTTLMGVMRVAKPIFDYRKQRVPAGVYTLRLASQPMDGDHMGTAPYSHFVLASPAGDDKKPGPIAVKALQEMSGKTTEGHPAVFLLFPGKGATAKPALVNKGMGHWVLFSLLGADADGKKATLPIGLTLVGASASA